MRERMHLKSLCPHGFDMLPGSEVVSKFTINNSSFLIVTLKDCVDIEEAEIHLKPHAISAVGHFKTEGQFYLIIKEPSTPPDLDSDLSVALTGRELQITMLVALGQSNKQIANQLHISEWTISTHLRRIFIKLGVDSRAAMVYRCAGLIQRLQSHYEAQQINEEHPAHLIEWLSQNQV